jgi:hypothetical protein
LKSRPDQDLLFMLEVRNVKGISIILVYEDLIGQH